MRLKVNTAVGGDRSRWLLPSSSPLSIEQGIPPTLAQMACRLRSWDATTHYGKAGKSSMGKYAAPWVSSVSVSSAPSPRTEETLWAWGSCGDGDV